MRINVAVLAAISLSVFLMPGISVPDLAADVLPEESDANEEMKFDEDMARVEMGGRVTGQVVTVNPQADLLVVRYGRELVTLTVNDDTTYYGAESLKTMNPGDMVSVDTVSTSAGCMADNIVIEKRYTEDDEPLPSPEKVLSD